MPFNGKGQFTLKYTWVNEANAGTPILATHFDDQESDIAAALSNTITRDGQSTILANLPMGGFKLTGLGPGTAASDSVNYGQVFNAPAFVTPTATTSPTISDNRLRLATVGTVQDTAFQTALPLQSRGLLFSDGTHASFAQSTAGFALNASKGADIPSASTIDLTAPTGEFMHVTGTTTINAITVPVGAMRALVFDGVLTLKNSGSLQLPGGADITTQAGDRVTVRGDTSGTIAFGYQRADGSALFVPVVNVLGTALGSSYNVPAYTAGMSTLQTDTVQTAFGKLQSQANNALALIGNKIDASALAASSGSSLIGFIHAISGAVSRTAQNKLRDTVHVNDFGGDLKVALQDVSEYTTIVLAAATYDVTGLFTNNFNFGAGPFVGNTKRGIRLQGAGMPRVADDGQSLIGGTVIQGTLLNLADGFEVYDLGVDVGKTVCTTKYAGAFAEGLILGLNPNYPSATTTIKGVKADRVIALGNAPTADNSTWKHSVLCENLEGPRIGSITSVGGYHVYVDKCIGMQCGSVTALGGAGESVFFGANIGNACRLSQYGQIRVDSWFLNSVEQKAGGVVFSSNDAASPYLSKVKIGSLMMRNLRAGIDAITDGGNSIITDCSIGHLDVDMASNGAAFRMGYGATSVQRFVIGSHNIVTAGRAFELGAASDSCHIGSGTQTFTADALNPLMAFETLRYAHGTIQMVILTGQSAPYMISRTAGDVLMDMIAIGGPAGIPASRYLSSVQGSLALTSANFVDGGLVGQASNGARYVPYRVELTGSAKAVVAGTDLNLGTVSPPPRVNMRFIVPSETSPGVFVQRCLEITSAGVILARGSTANGEVITLNPVNYSLLV